MPETTKPRAFSTRGRSPSLGLALLCGLRFFLSRGLIALFLLFDEAFYRSQHHKHRTAFHLRSLFDRAYICKVRSDLFQVFECDLGIIHLTTAEPDRHTHFMSL